MRFWLVSLLLLIPGSMAAHGQRHEERGWGLAAQAVGLVTRASPALDGRSMREWYLTQPAIMAHAGLWGGALTASGTLNFGRWTLDRGELNAGIWGKGTSTDATPYLRAPTGSHPPDAYARGGYVAHRGEGVCTLRD